MWPWFERLPASKQMSGGIEIVSASSYPQLAAWMDAMWKIEPVKKTMLPTHLHVEFLESFKTGTPAYNAGLVQAQL